MNLIKKHKWFFFLFFIILWVTFVSPEKVVSLVGVEKGYLLIFIFALFGVSGFTSAPFYTLLFTFIASGEFNVFLLALVSAPAMTIGDSLFFFLGYKGHGVVGGRLHRFSSWIEGKPQWITPLFAYLYSSFFPLPQDVLMVFLGLGKCKFRYIFFAVLFGNITFILFTASVFLKLI